MGLGFGEGKVGVPFTPSPSSRKRGWWRKGGVVGWRRLWKPSSPTSGRRRGRRRPPNKVKRLPNKQRYD